ncbi:unnamed protein product, partial [Rotaria sp. Silwood1]
MQQTQTVWVWHYWVWHYWVWIWSSLAQIPKDL